MDFRLVLAITILAASGCISGSGQTDINASDFNQSEEENVTMVYYTDAGFVPEEVEVKKGDEVRWVDESSNPMWVAVDRHPVHSEYDDTRLDEHCPGDSFDQCEAGDVYSFTFEKEGEWSYHNHNNARHTGMVTVEE